jgi:hypothetical protein
MTHADLDRMMYIEAFGRPWCAWVTPENDLMIIAADEKPFGEKDMEKLGDYLYEEGFFPDYFKSKLAEAEDTY